MTLRNTPTRWGAAAQALHWLIAPLVVAQFALVWYGATLPRGPALGTVYAWHKSIGATVLILAAARLIWRLFDTPPPLPATVPAWQRAGATLGHALLYLLIFAQPLTGLLLTLTGRNPLVLYGGLIVPSPWGPNHALHEAGEAAHFWLGYALLAVAVLHLAAALYHHLVRRDGVLLRMLPGRAAAQAQLARDGTG